MAGTDHLTEIEVWSNFECAGGSLITNFGVAAGTHPLISLRHHEILEDHTDTLTGEYSQQHAVHSDVRYGRALRAVYDTAPHREWRISDVSVERREGGAQVARFVAQGPHKDLALRAGIATMPLANGGKMHRIKLIMTPTEWLNYIDRNSDMPSWVQVGTVDFTERIYVALDGHNPWRADFEIADAAAERENAPAYLRLTRNGTTAYDLNILLDPAAGADTVSVTYSENELTLTEREIEEKFASRVFMKSSEHDGVQMTLAENGFEVSGVSVDTLTMLDELLGEDDQVNGLYVERPDLTTTEITDSTAPSTIVVADGTGIAAGDIVRIVADAAGSDLIYLGSPVGQAAHGIVTRTLERPDILPVKNLGPDGFLLQGTTVPTGWQKIGNPTVVVDTSDNFSQFGLKSWHITAADGEGLELATPLPVHFSDRVFRYQYVTFGVVIWLISGAAVIELDDETDPANIKTYFDPDTSKVAARTNETGRWIPLYVFPGINFFHEAQPRQFRPRIYADGLAEFYWDAWIMAHAENPSAIPDFREGSGANDLWFVARDYLRAFGQAPPKYYDTQFVDRNRVGLLTSQAVTLGGDVDITDAPIGVGAITKRIVEVDRDLLVDGRTEIVPERIPAHLADRFLGRSRPPIVKETPENVQPPDCGLNLKVTNIGDLVITWDARNWHTVKIVDVTGVPGSGQTRFDAGTTLYVGRATQFVMKYDQTGTSGLPDPALVGAVMIEAYNPWGKPGKCLELAQTSVFVVPGVCANLITDPGVATTFCNATVTSGGASGILLRDPPVVLPYSNVQTFVTRGSTRLTVCHKGSSSGVAHVINGYAASLKSFIAGFNHGRLERYDAGVATNPWSHSNVVIGGNTIDKFVAIGAKDTGSGTNDIRIAMQDHTGPLAPSWNNSPTCCGEVTADYYGDLRQPGIAVVTSESQISWAVWHAGYRAPHIECDNLSSNHLFLSRAAGHAYLGAASYQTTTTQTGLGEISAYSGNDRAGGRWTQFEVRSSGGATVATFLASDHPDGAVWYGDRYVYDAGGTLVIGVGGVIAVNSAGTLGLIESGFMVETDFAIAGAIPAGYLATGVTLQNNRLEFGAGGRILYQGAGSSQECVSEAIVRVPATTAHELAAIVGTPAPDVRAAVRVTFDDPAGTTVLSGGVGDGVDLGNFIQERAWTGVWPVGADNVTIEQLQIGAGSGQACSKDLEMVLGGVCCAQTFVPPQIGLPPITIDCLISASLIINSVDTCAGGGGVSLTANWTVDPNGPCLSLDVLWTIDVMWLEEYDPTNFPGVFDLIRHDKGVALPTTGTYTAPPITNEDPNNLGPGNGRGTDGMSPVPKRWRARVILRNAFASQGGGVIEDTQTAPAYDWCP